MAETNYPLNVILAALRDATSTAFVLHGNSSRYALNQFTRAAPDKLTINAAMTLANEMGLKIRNQHNFRKSVEKAQEQQLKIEQRPGGEYELYVPTPERVKQPKPLKRLREKPTIDDLSPSPIEEEIILTEKPAAKPATGQREEILPNGMRRVFHPHISGYVDLPPLSQIEAAHVEKNGANLTKPKNNSL